MVGLRRAPSPDPTRAPSCYLVQAEDADGRTWNVAARPRQRRPRRPAALPGPGRPRRGRRCPTCTPTTWPTSAVSTCTCATGPAPRRGPRPLPGARAVRDRLAAGRRPTASRPGENLDGQLTVHTWQAGDPIRSGRCASPPVPVEHPVPAYGVRVEGPSEATRSRTVTLAYTGDTDTCDGPGRPRGRRGPAPRRGRLRRGPRRRGAGDPPHRAARGRGGRAGRASAGSSSRTCRHGTTARPPRARRRRCTTGRSPPRCPGWSSSSERRGARVPAGDARRFP